MFKLIDNLIQKEKRWKIVEKKKVEGLIFMVTEEAKEQLNCSNKKE